MTKWCARDLASLLIDSRCKRPKGVLSICAKSSYASDRTRGATNDIVTRPHNTMPSAFRTQAANRL
jgi:hypothetical protein